MATLNKVFLLGNVGSINVKTFGNDNKVVEMTLATTERYTNRDGEKVEDTQWHKLIVNGRQADTAEKYVGKGDSLLVEGRLRYRKYNNRDGQEVYVTEIVVTNFQMLSRRSDAQQQAPQQRRQSESVIDDFPF